GRRGGHRPARRMGAVLDARHRRRGVHRRLPSGLLARHGASRRMRRWLAPAALAAYAISVAVIELRHEPWRDEADCWLLARDADAVTFFHRMGLVGTPGLWHLVLVPFARIGLPY